MTSKALEFIDRGPSHTLCLRTKKRKYLRRWDGHKFVMEYGLFYSSWDKKRHIAPYVPYRILPSSSGVLCGTSPVNYSSTRDSDSLCPVCLAQFRKLFPGGDLA